MSDKPIKESQITTLLLGLEQRGKEASGVVLVDKDSSELHILKDGIAAQYFVERPEYKKFLSEHLSPKTRTVLVHARQHTIGTPRDNKNNHPLFAGNCAVVHNGHVSNHFEQFSKRKLERNADVDSDIIRAICDKEGLTHKTVRELSDLSGSIAAAIIDKRRPNCVLLLRSGNPLCLGISDDHIIFASIQKVVAAASKTWTKRWGVWSMKAAKGIDYSIFPSDSAWFFGPNEKEWHQKFETAAYCYNPAAKHYGMYGAWSSDDNFESYREDAGDTAGLVVKQDDTMERTLDDWEYYYRCPKCKWMCLLDKDNVDHDPATLKCRHCDTSLKGCSKTARMRNLAS